jgi:hypothetical protein
MLEKQGSSPRWPRSWFLYLEKILTWLMWSCCLLSRRTNKLRCWRIATSTKKSSFPLLDDKKAKELFLFQVKRSFKFGSCDHVLNDDAKQATLFVPLLDDYHFEWILCFLFEVWNISIFNPCRSFDVWQATLLSSMTTKSKNKLRCWTIATSKKQTSSPLLLDEKGA